MRGKLRSGDKLPTERQLAEELNVSRTTVREALKALEAMGIARSVQGSGAYITEQPEDSINLPLCALFALTNGTLDNILQMRLLLEGEACRDIVRYADDEEVRSVTALANYNYSTPVDDQSLRDARFHRAIVSCSRNPMTRYLYNTLSTLMDIYRSRVLDATIRINENDITRQGHYAICEALEHRDEDGVLHALAAHLELNEFYRWSLEHPPERT